MKKHSMAHGPVGCQSHHGKRPGSESERSISYPLETLNTRHHPLERDVRDTPATPPLNGRMHKHAGPSR
ncbi:hypothetical protein CRUP_021717 [Coryphaenoides rupestris]|nr:hypothetical protein CRUP_021717 [Coryphaenoides rupestris]